MQAIIGLIYLILVIAITAVFLLIFYGSKTKAAPKGLLAHVTHLETAWILALVVTAVVFTLATMSLIHYPGLAAPLTEDRQIVKVEGLQFGWVIEPKEIKAGVPVEFQVTSHDVNHGFGVTDADGVLLFQVQAMPKYLNRVIYTFEEPGIYKIICLEYCGLFHHIMIAELKVVP